MQYALFALFNFFADIGLQTNTVGCLSQMYICGSLVNTGSLSDVLLAWALGICVGNKMFCH